MQDTHTILGALAAGMVTSLHCAGMCGPIACGLSSMPAGDASRLMASIAYHGSRLASYTIIGALCGIIGKQPLAWFFDSPLVLMPWILVLVFLIFALGLEKRLPRPPMLLKFAARMRFRTARLTPVRSGLALGFITPLLPCGPLYLLFGASLLTGSALRGAEFALAFGLGTVPLLWIAQHQFHLLHKRLKPASMARIRRSLALVTAVVLTWRLHGTLPPLEAATETRAELPSCCHPD